RGWTARSVWRCARPSPTASAVAAGCCSTAPCRAVGRCAASTTNWPSSRPWPNAGSSTGTSACCVWPASGWPSRVWSRCRGGAGRRSVLADAHYQLAEVAAFEQVEEGLRCSLQSLDAVLAVLDAAFGQLARHVAGELRIPRTVVVEDDEAAHGDALGKQGAHQQRQTIRPFRQRCGVVLGDQPAQRHPRQGIEQRQHGVEDLAADV